MKNAFRRTALLTLALVVLGVAPRANAGSQTFTTTFGSAGSPLSVPFSLPLTLTRFDTSLGTLTSVTLTLTNNANVQTFVVNFGSASTFSNALGSSTVTAVGPNSVTTIASATAGPYSGSLGAGTFTTPTSIVENPVLVTATAVTNVASSDFGAYSGVGPGTFTVAATAANSASGTSTGSFTAFGATSTAYGSLSVTYVFTTAIPEPASFAMVGIGMGTFFVVRRFRRRSA